MNAPAILSQRATPTRRSHIAIGDLFHLTGAGEGIDQLPTQVFRLERIQRTHHFGSETLVGTLFWRVWVHGRAYSGAQTDHHLALHHVSIGEGSRLSSRHDFHFERIEKEDLPRILGDGHATQKALRRFA